MIEANRSPACNGVAGFAGSRGCNMRRRLAGRGGAVVARRASATDTGVVEPDVRPGTRRMALFALSDRLDVVHRLAGAEHAVVAGAAIIRQRNEFAAGMARFAGNGPMAPFKGETRGQVIERRFRIKRCGVGDRQHDCRTQRDNRQYADHSQEGPEPIHDNKGLAGVEIRIFDIESSPPSDAPRPA